MKNYYEILGVLPNATQEEITERYRFLVMAYHPDRYSNTRTKEMAEEELKIINEAYEILSNESKRIKFDEWLYEEFKNKEKPQYSSKDVTQAAEEKQNRENPSDQTTPEYSYTAKEERYGESGKKKQKRKGKLIIYLFLGILLIFLGVATIIYYQRPEGLVSLFRPATPTATPTQIELPRIWVPTQTQEPQGEVWYDQYGNPLWIPEGWIWTGTGWQVDPTWVKTHQPEVPQEQLGEKTETAVAQSAVTQTAIANINKAIEISSSWKLFYYDYFDTKSDIWDFGELSYGNVGTVTTYLENNKFRVKVKPTESSWAFVIFTKTEAVGNFSLSVEVNQFSSIDTSYGVIFRLQGDKFYTFIIDEYRNSAFFYFRGNSSTKDIMSVKTNSIISNGTNRLKVIAIGNWFVFFINGQMIGEAYDDNLNTGMVGLVGFGSSLSEHIFDFDTFELSAP